MLQLLFYYWMKEQKLENLENQVSIIFEWTNWEFRTPSLVQTPTYYGKFGLSGQNAHTGMLCLEFTCLIQTLNTDTG